MQKKRTLPVRILREFFSYNPRTGELRYQPNRARHWFKSDRLWKSWNAQNGGKIAVHINKAGYAIVMVNQRKYTAHRVIWAMMTGEWPKEEIDHINQQRADNRWVNLRAVTRDINAINRVMPINNTSGAMGVDWWQPGRLWRARGSRGYKEITKYASSFEEAVMLREQIKRRLGMTERHGNRR